MTDVIKEILNNDFVIGINIFNERMQKPTIYIMINGVTECQANSFKRMIELLQQQKDFNWTITAKQ
jgi:hypothetical protein